MKAITWYQWNETSPDLGELIHEIDISEAYEQDGARLYKKGTKYTLLESSGCSCWDGDWDGWTELTKKDLRTLGESWAKNSYGAGLKLGEWIKENI